VVVLIGQPNGNGQKYPSSSQTKAKRQLYPSFVFFKTWNPHLLFSSLPLRCNPPLLFSSSANFILTFLNMKAWTLNTVTKMNMKAGSNNWNRKTKFTWSATNLPLTSFLFQSRLKKSVCLIKETKRNSSYESFPSSSESIPFIPFSLLPRKWKENALAARSPTTVVVVVNIPYRYFTTLP